MADNSVNARGSVAADPIRNFRFIVSFYPTVREGSEVPGWKPVGRFGFTSVSGFGFSLERLEIREGGYNTTAYQVPTHVRHSGLQLDRGISLGTRQNWDWMRMMFRTVQGRAQGAEAFFRSDVEIAVLVHPVPYSTDTGFGREQNPYQTARDDDVALRFRVYNAWPSSVIYSDVNSGDNALMVERMTLVHEGIDLKWGDQVNGEIVSAGDFGVPRRA
jgi:phage tail-like protein